MSQNFKLKFDEMQESNPATASDNNTSGNDLYDTPGHVRNLCFVWPDGRMKFLNYAYLISGDYTPDHNTLTLIYTTHLVIIKGSKLLPLYNLLLTHSPRKIICTDERYKLSLNEHQTIIECIEITSSF
ncbi:hypothetical protein [Mucilaginibacter phyllosphaerae]|uniref:Uncharacterized protein n=1 Tax=Mucilaginibacter phyllosphaerae TaxID=1812349 RepID=A0A4Y8ABH5_9SPHI|nr:hypothetical protein [Mucilaginibacter phyllosphaerae]MBB3969299.1 hypothetical protein [Mucilaginibacter phyllosphaerae]TEW65904.1 hypothetical protein E2R65_12280 [Mucilaginibacter phyllosphaerae]